MNQAWYMALFLLIPVAYIAGWWTSRKKTISNNYKSQRNSYPDYFRGLNYVLNEQPDKAIEIFVKMIEVDSESIETHLALGNLFRRRGEVDRAIRIHQNLIARPTLSKEYRGLSYFELGKDYLKLGILDRAEKLFQDLIEMEILTSRAYEHLLEIYQQQRDWEKAIYIARRLESISSNNYAPIIAQYHCEIAINDLNNGDGKNAKDLLKRALRLDSKCVRASIMEGDLLFNKENYKAAITAYKRIENQDPEYIGEVLPLLERCYQKIGKEEQFKIYLLDLADKNSDYSSQKILAGIIAKDDGYEKAITFLQKHLQNEPTILGVDQLLLYIIANDSETNSKLRPVKNLMDKILESRPEYQCNVCGFEAKQIHWYCPGCKSWSSVKPISGGI